MENKIQNIKQQLSFISLTEEEWDNIIGQIDIHSEKLLPTIMKIIKENYPNKYTLSIIIKFINHQFNPTLKETNINNNFQKLNQLIEEQELEITPEILETLIANETIKNSIEFFLNKYRKIITEGNIDKLFDNQILIALIEYYCDINKIEIKNDEENIENSAFIYNRKDPIYIYLQEIGKIPLLKREEEIELAKRIEKHDEEARQKLIESNLRLVASVAKKYINRGISFQDLIEEGNTGLIKAVDKYDYRKGTKFGTYAVWWIKQTIYRSLYNDARIIRIPIHHYEKINQLKNEIDNLTQELNRKPTVEEIEKVTGKTKKEIEEMLQEIEIPVSINQKVNIDSDSEELGQFIPSKENLEEDFEKKNLRKDILKVFDLLELSEIERTILIKRYGLDGQECMSLEAIGNLFNVTRERIRQIQKRAEKKIFYSRHSKILKGYLETETKTQSKRYEKIDYNNLEIMSKIPKEIDEYLTKHNFNNPEKLILLLTSGIITKKPLNELEIHKTFGIPIQYIKKLITSSVKKLEQIEESEIKTKLTKNLKIKIKEIKFPRPLYLSIGCTKEELMKRIEYLKEEERNIIFKKTGLDFDHPKEENPLSNREKYQLYNVIIPKLKKMMNTNEEERREEQELEKINPEKVLSIFQSPNYKEILNYLTPQQTIIFLLKTGYFNNKFYTTQELSTFLNTSEEEIEILFRESIKIYIKKTNETLDNSIEKMQQYNQEDYTDNKIKEKSI